MGKRTFFNLLDLFESKLILPLLVIFTIINGVWSSILLFIINNKISGASLPFGSDHDWVIYLFFVVISFIISYYFKRYMIRIASKFSNKMNLKTIDNLRTANYESYLHIGEARIRTVMEDVTTLSRLPKIITAVINASVLILVTIAYMFWLHPQVAFLTLGLTIVLSLVLLYRNKHIEKYMDEARELDNIFMRNYNDFLHGYNKIKMSVKRSKSIYFDHISSNRNEAIELSIKSELAGLVNLLMGEFSFYFLIGFLLFIMPIIFEIDKTVVSGFMVAIMFLMGPLITFVTFINDLLLFKVSFKRLNEFNEITRSNNFIPENISSKPKEIEGFENLNLNNIGYEYVDDNGKVIFNLKPINLKIQKGEVIFISGGNGSGKSTFMNLLSGLYIPKSGEIFYNKTLINDDNRFTYRDKISCIFSDSYLFTENYDDFNLQTTNQELKALFSKMELDKVIRIDDENNKIFHDLSSGQKKRLELVYSLLEDKDIFIFDEWAAEQDPYFRKYFYENLIPELRSKGKTIIAITHDDAYYKLCDRLIKFDYGELLEKDIQL